MVEITRVKWINVTLNANFYLSATDFFVLDCRAETSSAYFFFLTFYEAGALLLRSPVSVFEITSLAVTHFLAKLGCGGSGVACQSSPFLELNQCVLWLTPAYFGLVGVSFISDPLPLSRQIHKQAPPLEDIAEDCSLTMRCFLKRALERNPSRRSSASELLKDEAINPPREDQPRCWSLDSALEEVTLTLLRQQSENQSTTQGMPLVCVWGGF